MPFESKYDMYRYSDYLKTDLPEHWEEKRLGYLADQGRTAFVDGPFGSDLKTSDYKDSGVPLIQLNNIRDSKHLMQNMKFIAGDKKQQLIRHLALPGDIVIAKMAEPVARCAIVSDEYAEYVIVADCVKLTANKYLVDLSYLVWAINCDHVKINAELVSTGTTRIRINLGELKKLKVPYPPIEEQQKIANFLDHETAKIDTLIEKQQQLIKLLKEKRQAVISHAVTKGLNPNAPMRDSGVEWLGEVPEHWEVKRLKNTSDIVDCRNKTPEYFDDGEYLVVRTTNIKNQKLNMNSALYTDEACFKVWTQRGVPPAGSIFFTREAPAGEVCLVPDNLKFCMGQRMMNFICHDSAYTSYLFDYLLSDCLERYIESVSHGSTVSHLRVEQVENIPVIVPPLREAKAIYEELAVIKGKYLTLTEEAEKAIGLMQERRTALISAAVTGKIDVRDFSPEGGQPPEPSNTASQKSKDVAA